LFCNYWIGEIGITLDCEWHDPANKTDIDAAERAIQFHVKLIL
jgi:hypothetical protein